MRRAIAVIVLGVALAMLTVTPASAVDCEFRLGFKTLRDLIGHDIVGECLENEHYNAIGDSNQHTTGGLMAWRKADNWTAFTDGYRTWIAGPNGLVQRLNTERFDWEQDPPPPAATPAPTPAPTPTPAPRPTIDPRLQPVLDFIAGTSTGDIVLNTLAESGAGLVYGNISDAAHYNPNTNMIMFDEGMSSQPVEVLAFILAHETYHTYLPWTERGEECYNSELGAEGFAVAWWQSAYGNAGHPHPAGNDFITYFNHVLWLWVNDIEGDWDAHIRDVYRDVCGPVAIVATPTPTPTPRPGIYDQERVDLLFQIPDAFGRHALAELFDVNPTGGNSRHLTRYFANAIEALPMIYVMHVWVTGGTESGHPLLDVDQFALAYFSDHLHYVRVVRQWLDNLEANPCAALPEARDWVIRNENYMPGGLRAYMALAGSSEGNWYGFNRGLEDAALELYDNPNATIERYGCVD